MPYDKLIISRALFRGDLGRENTATRMLLLWLMFKSKDGLAKATPEQMARGLGVKIETVHKALDRLTSPSSDWPESGGARIVETKDGLWRIVKWDQNKGPGREYERSQVFTGVDRSHPEWRKLYQREYRKRKTEEKKNYLRAQACKHAVNKTENLGSNSEKNDYLRAQVCKHAVNKTDFEPEIDEVTDLRGTPPLSPLQSSPPLNNPSPLPPSPLNPPSPHCTDAQKKRQDPVPRKALNLRGNPKYAQLWEDFKLVYPRRLDGRAMRLGEGRKIFDTLLDHGEDPNEIVMGAKRFGDYVRLAHAEKFVPMVTTWLNQRRWEEEHSIEKGSLEAKQIALDKVEAENRRRAQHQARFYETYLAWTKSEAERTFEAQREAYTAELKESLKRRKGMAAGRSSKAVTAIEEALASEEAMKAAYALKVVHESDFWKWDAAHNPDRLT